MGELRIGGGPTVPAAGQSAPASHTKVEQPSEPQASAASFSSREDPGQTILDSMREAREKMEAHRDKLNKSLSTGKDYGSLAASAYMRLSRARTPSQAGSAGGYARRCIAMLQGVDRRDPDNAHKVRAAVRQLRKAVARAGKKQRELRQEALSDKQRQRLEEERQQTRARRLRDQQSRSRTQRSIRESGYFRELEIDNRLADQLTRAELELRQQAQTMSAPLSPDAAIRQYAAQTAPPAEPTISAEA